MWIIICKKTSKAIVGSAQKSGWFGTESLLVSQGQFPAIWWYWWMALGVRSGYTVYSVREKERK